MHASRSLSWTISIGECMFRSGIETRPGRDPFAGGEGDVRVGVRLRAGLDRVVDPLLARRLDEELEHARIDGRPAEDRRAAAERVVTAGRRVVCRNVGRVGDVDRDRDGRPEPVRGRHRAVRAELLLRGRHDGDVRALGAPQRLERDVDAGAVVQRPRRQPAVRELERRRVEHHRIAGRDQRARLLAVLGADVDVELPPLDLLVVLHLARDHAGDGAVLRPDLDALAVGDVRAPAAQLVHGDQPVVGDVRDGGADHVQMGEERQQRPVTAAARDQVPDRVGLDLGDARRARRGPRRYASCSCPDGPCARRSASRVAGTDIAESLGLPLRSPDREHHDGPADPARRLPAPARGRGGELPARVGRAGPARAPLLHRLGHAARLVRGGGGARRAGRRLSRVRPRREARADGAAPADGPELPESRFVVAETLVRFDHGSGTAEVLAGDATRSPRGSRRELVFQKHKLPSERSTMRRTPDQATYEQGVERIREYIRAGDAFQVVLSQRAERPTSASALELYRALRRVNPSPYLFLLELGELALVGSSPETLVKCEDGRASLNPIAGTTHPGDGDAERLLASEKDRAEHVMLVDLGRNDLSRVCKPASVKRRALPRARALLARHAPRLGGDRRAAGRRLGVRPAARLLPGRDRLRRPEGPRDADRLRARGLSPRPVRRRRRLRAPGRGDGHVHRDPDDRPRGRRRAAAGGRAGSWQTRIRRPSTASACPSSPRSKPRSTSPRKAPRCC